MVKKKSSENNHNSLGPQIIASRLDLVNALYGTRLVIPTSDGREYLNPKDIIRIEADRSYSWFFISDKRKILVSKHLKEFQEILNDRNFFRPHNSHLINLDFVNKYIRHDGGYIEMTDGSKIPIASNRKDLFLAHMSRYTG